VIRRLETLRGSLAFYWRGNHDYDVIDVGISSIILNEQERNNFLYNM
jgi:hypothetical protein